MTAAKASNLPHHALTCQVPGCGRTFQSQQQNRDMCLRCERVLLRRRKWLCRDPQHEGDPVCSSSWFGWDNRSRRRKSRCRYCVARNQREKDRATPPPTDPVEAAARRAEIHRRLLGAAECMEGRDMSRLAVRLIAGKLV